MKYLGLYLDGNWSFVGHFERLAPRLTRVASGLAGLLPNLGGPDARVRRLYAGVVHSVSLYGAPVWAERALASRKIQGILNRVQRRLTGRVSRTYRTVSHAANTVLAGFPPMELLASMHAEVYRRVREIREGEFEVTERARAVVKLQARRSLMARWSTHLTRPGLPGQRTVEAIRPCLQRWVGRGWRGNVPFGAGAHRAWLFR